MSCSDSPRDGRFIEKIGTYNPLPDAAEVNINVERLQHWIQRGAKPTDTVASLIRKMDVQAVNTAS